jgi:hypothetical protein
LIHGGSGAAAEKEIEKIIFIKQIKKKKKTLKNEFQCFVNGNF